MIWTPSSVSKNMNVMEISMVFLTKEVVVFLLINSVMFSVLSEDRMLNSSVVSRYLLPWWSISGFELFALGKL